MSEDRRKALRTQGRFSDEFKKKSYERAKKTPPKESDSGSTKSEMMAQSYVDILKEQPLTYTGNSTYTDTFEELSTKKVPIEIKTSGKQVLSESTNGISRIFYETAFMDEDEAMAWFLSLYEEIKFDKRNIIIRGEEHPQPRLVAWFGPYPYTYSGLTLEPAEMPESVLKIKDLVEKHLRLYNLNVELNSVLLNLYEHGKHSIAWHSDDELTMGVQPTIASVSLGATRRFQMRRKPHLLGSDEVDTEPDYYINLTNGSLLVMDGCMQKDWQHRVPKEFHDKRPRINLTFRTVYALDKLPTEIVPKTHDQVQESNKSLMKKTENISDNRAPWCSKELSSTETVLDGISSEQIEHFDPSEFPLLSISKDSTKPLSDYAADISLPTQSNAEDETTQNDVQNKSISADSTIESASKTSLNDKNHNVSDNNSDRSLKPNLLKPCPPFSNKNHTEILTSLNVNAPSFVPKCQKSSLPAFSEKRFNSSAKFEEKPLDEFPVVPDREQSTNATSTCRQRLSHDLLDLLQYPTNELVENYSFIIEEISNSLNCSLFSDRDKQELRFLCEISNDQNAKNQGRICVRIRNVVMDAFSVHTEARRIRNNIEARSNRFRNSEPRQIGPPRHNKNVSPRHQQQRFDRRSDIVYKKQ